MSTSSRATDSLLRVYLHDALYSAEHGYLWNHVQKSLKKGPDGSPVPRPMINFGDLGSKWEYQKSIDDVLKETGASWLSPFELYNPWYGHALGKYILESHVGPAGISSNASGKGRAPRPDSPPPLQIFELRKAHPDDEAINATLDEIFDAIINNDLETARELLAGLQTANEE